MVRDVARSPLRRAEVDNAARNSRYHGPAGEGGGGDHRNAQDRDRVSASSRARAPRSPGDRDSAAVNGAGRDNLTVGTREGVVTSSRGRDSGQPRPVLDRPPADGGARDSRAPRVVAMRTRGGPSKTGTENKSALSNITAATTVYLRTVGVGEEYCALVIGQSVGLRALQARC